MMSGVESSHFKMVPKRRFLEIILHKKDFFSRNTIYFKQCYNLKNTCILAMLHTYTHIPAYKGTKVHGSTTTNSFSSHYWLQCLRILQPQMAPVLIK